MPHKRQPSDGVIQRKLAVRRRLQLLTTGSQLESIYNSTCMEHNYPVIVDSFTYKVAYNPISGDKSIASLAVHRAKTPKNLGSVKNERSCKRERSLGEGVCWRLRQTVRKRSGETLQARERCELARHCNRLGSTYSYVYRL